MLFAFFIGMTSSVSDVGISSRDMRWMTMLHGIISFVFNLLILHLHQPDRGSLKFRVPPDRWHFPPCLEIESQGTALQVVGFGSP